jgi:hypothetical protein
MAAVSDLIGLDHTPEMKKRRKEVTRILTTPITYSEFVTPSRKYQCDVFNFLLSSKDALAIEAVIEFANLRVDGAIVLKDGRRLAIEIKYRMNWKKALEAGYEFRRFLLSLEARCNPVQGAIVFFEEFDGSGWDKQPRCRLLENGWNEWYRSHSRLEGYQIDLLRLRGEKLQNFAIALATARLNKTAAQLLPAYLQLSDTDKATLSERIEEGAASADKLP